MNFINNIKEKDNCYSFNNCDRSIFNQKTTVFNLSKHICKYFDVPCPTIVEVISISDVDEGVICKSLKLVQDPEVITV